MVIWRVSARSFGSGLVHYSIGIDRSPHITPLDTQGGYRRAGGRGRPLIGCDRCDP